MVIQAQGGDAQRLGGVEDLRASGQAFEGMEEHLGDRSAIRDAAMVVSRVMVRLREWQRDSGCLGAAGLTAGTVPDRPATVPKGYAKRHPLYAQG